MSNFLRGVAPRCPCPKRKVIVMGCPETGTLSPGGLPPYDQTHAVDRDVGWMNSEHMYTLKLKLVHLHRYSSAFPHTRTRTAFPYVM